MCDGAAAAARHAARLGRVQLPGCALCCEQVLPWSPHPSCTCWNALGSQRILDTGSPGSVTTMELWNPAHPTQTRPAEQPAGLGGKPFAGRKSRGSPIAGPCGRTGSPDRRHLAPGRDKSSPFPQGGRVVLGVLSPAPWGPEEHKAGSQHPTPRSPAAASQPCHSCCASGTPLHPCPEPPMAMLPFATPLRLLQRAALLPSPARQ